MRGAAARPSRVLRFLLPSAGGLFVFFWPVEYGGTTTIPLDALTKTLGVALGAHALTVVCAVCILTALASLACTLARARLPPPGTPAGRAVAVFVTTPPWLAVRVVGGVAAACWLWQLGPAWLTADAVSRTALETVGVPVFLVFVTSVFFLPLLTDYGLMEFSGVLARPFFRRAFQLPGRASLDAVASWVSSGPVAVLITLRQYDAGFYTAREALTIIANFSVVSVPFSLVIAQVSGIGDHYLGWYASMVAIGLVCALVTPRLPPLSSAPDTFVDGSRASAAREDATRAEGPMDGSALRLAFRSALSAAERAPGAVACLRDGLRNLVDTVFGLVAACVGTVVLANLLLEYTPVFQWLSRPFVPVLELLGLREAEAAAPGLLIGFLDQFLPALVAGRLEDPHTQFVLAGLALVQIVYLSNFGVILLRSRLPVTLGSLLAIFAVRTVVALPLLVLASRVVIGPR